MFKKIFILIVIAALAACAYPVYTKYQEKKANENKKQERPEEPPVVNVTNVMKVDLIDERVFSGTTQAWSSFNIEPEVSAKLQKLNFDIGDKIKKGDLIASLDQTEYIQTLRQAEAELEVAKARYKEMQAMSKLRHSEFERQKQLLMSDATSLSDYETAESAMTVQDAETAQCEASILNCEAKLETAKVRLNYTRIVGNWESGSDIRFVGDRFVDEGALVSSGKPLLKIIEIDRIKAKIQIIERDFRFLKVGQEANITTDAYPGIVFKGKISNISNELSENTRNVTAIIEIPNKDLKLRPGMFVRTNVVLQEHKNAQVLPPNAVITKNGQRGVYVIAHGTNQAKFIPVETGISNRTQIEIVSPAEITEKVITIGNHLVDEGKKVVVSGMSRKQVVDQLVADAEAKKQAAAENAASKSEEQTQAAGEKK